jgi:hypothetical protein
MADEITLESLDERITALESKIGSGDYTLRYSGEEIDSFFDLLHERGFESGREAFTVEKNTPYQVVTLGVSSPTSTTRVIAVLRRNGAPQPNCNICMVLCYSTSVYAVLAMGANKSIQTADTYIPSGDYVIEWLVIGR